MLDWMKDKLARRQSPLQALAAAAFKDDDEKRALLDLLAGDEKLRAEELVPLLASADAAIQQRVATLFAARATPGAASALIEAALASDGTARATLGRVLARVKPDAVRVALEAMARDPKKERLAALSELAMELPPELGDPYIERAFKEGPPAVRVEALRRMVARRAPADMRATLLGALEDRDARVRRVAIDAAVKLEGPDVVEALLERMRDDSPEIRQIAGASLQRSIASAPAELRPQIIGRLLTAGDPEAQAKLVRALFAGSSPAELLQEILLFAKGALGAQHDALLDALKPLGDELAPHAVRLLEHADPDARVQAALLLERLGSGKTSAALVKLLGDADWWVRIMACEALGRTKDARTASHLEKMLGDADCKWAAMDALGAIGGDTALAALLSLLRDPQTDVRVAALQAVGRMDDRRVDRYVEEMSKTDASVDVRTRAVDLLRARRGGNAGGEGASHAQLSRPMEKLLAFARESGASDLHVTPGEPPFLRINGVLSRVDMKPLAREQVDALAEELLDPACKPVFDEKGAVDFCYALAGIGRYRVNVFRQLRGTAIAARVIPNVVPTLASLGLPKSLEEIGTYHQGIVLIAGAAGCGKSTTLTALVDVLNETRQTHVLTLEDPIEFLHTPKRALVNQRQVGRDTKSFAAAMRGALREDPDVVVIGELRDRETVRLAMIAAETGHLVIATMQTTSAVATIDKIVESFPSDEHQQIRVQLAGSMKLVVSQVLLPRAGGKGRVAAFEILKATSPVRAMIRDGKTFQIASAMQIGRAHDMLTLDASLEQLLAQALITLETAQAYAQKKETFAKAPVAQAAPPAAPAPAPPAAAAPRIPVLNIAAAPPAAQGKRASVAPGKRASIRPPKVEEPRIAEAPRVSSNPPTRNSRPPKRPSRRMPAQAAPPKNEAPAAAPPKRVIIPRED